MGKKYTQETLMPAPGLKHEDGRNFEHLERNVYFICDRAERFLYVYEFRLKELDAALKKLGKKVHVEKLDKFNQELADAAQEFIELYENGNLMIDQYQEPDAPEEIKFHVMKLEEPVDENVLGKKQVIYKNHPALWSNFRYDKPSRIVGTWELSEDVYLPVRNLN